MNSNREIYTDNQNYRVEKFSDDILLLTYLDGCDVTLEIAKEIVKIGNDIMEGEYYVLPDFTNMYGFFSREVGEYLAKDPEANDRVKGIACVLNGLPMRILVRTFINFNKPESPTKVFKSKEKAVEWISRMEGSQIKQA